MASPITTALAAATLVTNTNRTGVANQYLAWINAQPVPAIAALALEGVQGTSKYPARVLANAEVRYEELVDGGETGESGGGGGDSTYFEDLDEAEEGQVPVYDGTLGKFKPGTVASGGGAGPAAGALLFTADYTTDQNELTSQFPLNVDLGFTPPAGACIVVAVAIENGFGDPSISFPVMNGFGALWSRVGIAANSAGGGRHANFALYVGENCSGAAGHLTATQPNATTLALRAYIFEGGTYQSGSFSLGAANYYASGTHDHSVSVTPDNDNDISVTAFLTYPKITTVSDHHSGDTPTPWAANNNTSLGVQSSLTSPAYLRGRGGQAVTHGITVTGEQSVQGMGLVLNGI